MSGGIIRPICRCDGFTAKKFYKYLREGFEESDDTTDRFVRYAERAGRAFLNWLGRRSDSDIKGLGEKPDGYGHAEIRVKRGLLEDYLDDVYYKKIDINGKKYVIEAVKHPIPRYKKGFKEAEYSVYLIHGGLMGDSVAELDGDLRLHSGDSGLVNSALGLVCCK